MEERVKELCVVRLLSPIAKEFRLKVKKLVVVGGLEWDDPLVFNRSVEVLSIEEHDNTTCINPPFFEPDVYAYGGYFGDVYQNRLTLCGGWRRSGEYNTDCYVLGARNWTKEITRMKNPYRQSAAAIAGPRGFLVTGGTSLGETLKSTELYDGESWEEWTECPNKQARNCFVHFNTTHSMLIRGTNTGTVFAMLFDWGEGSWSTFNSEVEHYNMCGALGDGRIMAAGSHYGDTVTTVQIYDPTTGEWSYGPSAPSLGGKMVMVDGRPTIVGAKGIGNEEHDRLFQLKDEEWVELEVTLQVGRGSHLAFMVPVEDIPNCSFNIPP